MTWLALGIAVLIVVALPFWAEARRRPVDAKARRNATGDFADLTGGLTYHEWRGPSRGPVVVCVHGLTTPSYVWTPLAETLALKGFRVLTYDLFGRGLSDRPKGAQDSAFFLRQLHELLEDQKIASHVTLMGYSMGGAIATAYAARYPEAVDRLVLLAPVGMGHRLSPFLEACQRIPVLGDWLMRVFGGIVHRRGIDTTLAAPPSVPDMAARQRDEMSWRGTLPAVLSSQRGILGEPRDDDHRQLFRTTLPVLAIWGEEDALIPLAALGRLTQLNRRTRQVTLSGAGHSLPWTHPREVMSALSDFLADAEA
ncbi:alpha/beta fold hydrolase [Acidimangrovimonas sediminis]|uniref:alpha/beta fold hydrolase n=1 Tax=Acidimangrovimonas sediminis TaxID=2056283 RepID=UPI000C805209|nr:alpha/beta hydrolase [Acidimangrovimonas sediminis]